jgi:thiosulfate reductase cytochrome b subunit
MTAVSDPAEMVHESEHAVLKHHRGNRWMHWANFPILTVMIWSGLRIYWANRAYSIGPIELFPEWFNEALGLERRLAKGMAFHFTFGWVFTLNGVAYGLYLWRSGGWRKILPDRQHFKEAIGVLLHDLRLRREPPLQGKYNAAQRLIYTAVILMGGLIVVSGFAIYKPIQLSWLTSALGGYESARLVHFLTTMGFVLFFALHLVQVGRAGWANFASMITGYERRRGRGRD